MLKQDSVVKAYMIFARLSKTEQYSRHSKEINAALKTIRRRTIQQNNEFLRGTWKLFYEGYCTYPRCLDSSRVEKVIISKRKIRFYEKGELTKVYKYMGRVQARPHFGFIDYLVMYKDFFDDWLYSLRQDSKGRKRLFVEKYGGMTHEYFAAYTKLE